MLSIFNKSDAQLVRRTLLGQQEAFSLLVERHQEVVFAVAYGIVAHAADAEDVTQDAFLTAFDKLPSLREPAKFRAWLLSIARNRCSDVIVRRRREVPVGERDVAGPDASDGMADAELRVLLRKRIEGLPAEHREILLLHYYAGLKVREIAGQLNISTEAAKKRLQRARDLLSQRMLVHLRDTMEEQGTSAARTKSIIAAVAGSSAAWYGASAAAAGTGVLSVALVVKLAIGAVVTAGVVAAVMMVTDEPVLQQGAETTQTESELVGEAGTRSQPVSPAEDGAVTLISDAVVPSADEVANGGGILRGRVVDGAGMPQADIRITADTNLTTGPRNYKFGEQYETYTDEKGHFKLSGLLKGGRYILQAFGTSAFAAGDVYAVDPTGEDVDDIELVLLPATDLSGVVLDEAGNPVPNVGVVPFMALIDGEPEHTPTGWKHLRGLRTDAGGKFTLHHAWLGDWTLDFDSPAYVYKHAEKLDPAESPHTITLEAGASVSGRVVYTGTDDPIAGLELSMHHKREATTDEEGRFLFVGVAGSGGNVRPRNNDSLVVTSAPFAMFPGRETAGVQVEMAVGGVISGRVTDAATGDPVHFAQLSFRSQASAKSFYDVETERDGTYKVTRILPGRYVLASVEHGKYLGFQNKDGEPIELDFGVTIGSVDVELSQGVSVSGMVNFPEGASHDDVLVHAQYVREDGTQGGGGSRRVAKEGGFKIYGLSGSGTVTIQLLGPGWTSKKAGPFSLTGGNVTGVTLTAQRVNVGSIAGRVVQGSGTPRAGETVWLKPTDGVEPSTEESDEDGAFHFSKLTPGTYMLEVSGVDRAAQEVTVAPGQEVTGIRIDIAGGPGKISGRVLDWHGAPLAGARISAFGERALIPHVTSDEKGYYTLGGVGDSPVSLLVQAEGFARENMERVGPDSGEVDFKLKPLGAVEGTILDARTGEPIREFEVRSAHGATQGGIDNALKSAHQMTRQISPDGAFRATGLAPVEQAIVARASGYFGGYSTTTVRPGETVSGVVIRLEPAPRLQARVVDGNDDPVADAIVFINELSPDFGIDAFSKSVLRTDRDGIAPLENLLSGINEVYVHHSSQGRGAFQVDTKQDTGEVRFQLAATGRLEGVITLDGKPVTNTHLTVQYPSESGPQEFARYSAKLKSDGSYALEGLPAGDGIAQSGAGGRTRNAPVHIEVGVTTALNLELSGGTGTIELTPILPAALVEATPTASLVIDTVDGGFSQRVGTDDSGLIRMTQLPAGNATIKVTVGDRSGSQASRVLTREIGEGESIVETVDFATGATLSGRVSSADTDSRLFVVLVPGTIDPALLRKDGINEVVEQTAHQTAVVAGGYYRFGAVPPGGYVLVIVPGGVGAFIHQPVEVGGEDMEIDLALP